MHADAVLFDLFDTLLLIDNYEVYYPPSLKKLHESLDRNGVKIPFEDFSRAYFEVRDKFYSESRESLEEPHFNVRISQTLQKLGYNYDASHQTVKSATTAFADEFMRYVQLDADAPEVLQELNKRYKLGLVSNFAIPECGRKLLEKFNLNKFFHATIISGEVNQRKPSPAIFEKALKILNVEAPKTVFVGDMPDLDVLGPQKLGMKTVFIKRKPTEDNSNAKPDKTITSLKELLTILEDC